MSAARGWRHVTFISAGAGSGKTYRLTQELKKALLEGRTTPAGVIGTTFTVKAAAELRERVRDHLLAADHLELAERSAESLIGTVHSVCERLLKRFAFELGLSPQLNVMSIEDGTRFFNQALDQELALRRVREMNVLSVRLGLAERGAPRWHAAVKRVVDLARENDIDSTKLRGMAEDNVAELLRFFGKTLDADPTDELRRRVAVASKMLEDGIDPTDTTDQTKKYRQLLVEAETSLGRHDCPWQIWMRLATRAPGKKSKVCSPPVQEIAVLYEHHPRFQDDLRTFTRAVYEIAADCMRRFKQLKTDHGLIDFADMEQLTLHALDHEAVRERLRDELELLLVDEFQDTNPMQLALFLKLAALAEKAIFVGDVKQAIYEFRGCDPTLVFATLDGLAAGNAGKDVLPNNYRSQRNLLHYLNELFAAAFGGDRKQPIERHAVTLAAKRDALAGPAVTTWRLQGTTEDQRVALADGVARLVAEGELVVDPQSEQPRPVRFGDIAVLARTNAHVEEIARALRAKQLPMKMTLQGLLTTAEITLAKSCLRRVADRADTLASAEILALADCAQPEQWLADRLRWLEDGNESIAWGEENHPVIRRLKDLREESALRSPVEIVARVLNEVDIRRIVAAWGPDAIRAAQRQKNLDAFLDLAVEYEKHAAAHHDPGTLTGFLFWLEHPSSPDLDLQPVVTSGDAVHVLSYHRAKGLEWPVVICADFDYVERLRIFDTRMRLMKRFDISAPLAARQLRYWPNVFGGRKSGLPALDAIVASEEGKQWQEVAIAEQRRLAYVGMTRARDRLVLALPESAARGAGKSSGKATGKGAGKSAGKGKWMASFLQKYAIPTSDGTALPNGIRIPTACETIAASTEPRATTAYQARWFHRRERQTQTRKFLQPSSLGPAAAGVGEVGHVFDFGERIRLRGNEMADVGNGLHAILAAEFVNPLPEREALARAERMLIGHRVNGLLNGTDALAAARRFQRFVNARFAPSRIEVEVPVRLELRDGRVVRGYIDLLAETPAGWLIVDHKSSPQRKSTWRDEALKHGGQLKAYRDALAAAGRQPAACYIHFAVTGGLVEVRFGEAA